MTLYKYVHPDRIDILENLEIRFTQPDALNDPFELRPYFETLVAEADVLANLTERPGDLRPMVEQAYDLLPEAYRAMLPIEAAIEAVEAFMETDESRNAAAEGLRILLQSMRDGATPIREKIFQTFNENVGILSLSEVADDELMWAHYADSSRGFVLCFDDQHDYFNRRRTENDEFYHLRRVRYSNEHPRAMTDLDGDALMVTKGTQWEYEREWRMLIPLKDAVRTLYAGNDKVHLFAFPLIH